MTIDVDDNHGNIVLPASNGESPPEEWPFRRRTMASVSLSSRLRERKARKVARLLVALDRASGEQRSPVRERRRASLGLGRAA
jgi:hypothetical protein